MSELPSQRAPARILLIDPSEAGRRVLAERLRLQGFLVLECHDGAEGVVRGLEDPPAAVVADLSMPSISGIQLCRLLRSEAGTANVPVVLRGPDERRNHFWAEQAGAFAYVAKGRMGELVRALRRAIERATPAEDDFFVVTSTDGLDVRERIALHLDAALFDSVIAAEVRKLGECESFDRLIDRLSQFVSQVTTYRWLALHRENPSRLGIHANPGCAMAIGEARSALCVGAEVPLMLVEDDDAAADLDGPAPIIEPITFSGVRIGQLAVAGKAPLHHSDPLLLRTIARELGGPLRMATLIEESRLMASTDPLTGLLNRRAFVEWATHEVRRATRYADPLSVIILDVDHFKQINDRRGHASGDIVLGHLGRLLLSALRSADVVARWGGEEFVLALPSTPGEVAAELAERLRREVEGATMRDSADQLVPVTASFGVAVLRAAETVDQLIDRADCAMYVAKSGGRNKVVLAGDEVAEGAPELAAPRLVDA